MLKLKPIRPLIDWINERHAIYMRKCILEDAGARHPSTKIGCPKLSLAGEQAWGEGGWSLGYLTHDPVLRQYRFCNVFRELDRVTVWIRENIREPFADHEHLWFMLAIARFINWPPTLSDLIASTRAAWPDKDGFRPEFLTDALEARRALGKKVETGAFMIRAESDPKKEWYSWSKQRYVSEIALGRLWAHRHNVRGYLEPSSNRAASPSLRDVWEYLRSPGLSLVGWGPFMAHQVVVDLRHTRYLRNAPDVGRWAAIGPGSARGLNRLLGRPLKQSVPQDRALEEMLELSKVIHSSGLLAPYVPQPIELSDIQNALCETDKWLRARNGEGRPRSKYVPGRGS